MNAKKPENPDQHPLREIPQGIAPAYLLVAIAVIYLFVVIAAIRMAHLLHGETWALVCGALMLVPVVSLATLLILSRRATNRLQNEGIRVGFWGASSEDVQSWIKARLSVCVHCGFEAEKADSITCKHSKLRVHRTCKADHFAEAHAS